MEAYQNIITTKSVGNRAKPARETPVMRIVGHVMEGWAEQADKGVFVRWAGSFKALVSQTDPTTGEVRNLVITSTRLILPPVGTNYLGQYFEKEKEEVGPSEGGKSKKLGTHFVPRNEVKEGGVAIDLGLTLKPSDTAPVGYEYGLVPITPDKRLALFPELNLNGGATAWFDQRPLLEGPIIDAPDEIAEEAASTASA